MSHVVSSSAPISSAHTVKAYSGFGILGADIPTTGDNGGSPVLNDGVTSTSEYHWRVETAPSDGDLTIYPDLSFIWDGTGVADGSYPWVYRLFEDGVSQGTATVSQTVGAASGALVGQGSALTGASARTREHANTGALAGQGAAVAGTSNRTREHANTGVLAGQGAAIAGTAAHVAIHATTGALAGAGAAVVGTSARFRAMAATGALAGQGAAIAGSANHASGAVTHDTSGALAGAGAAVAGTAARTRIHAATGALAGQGAAVAGASARTRDHQTTGDLFGAGAVIVGSSDRSRVAKTHDTIGALFGAGAELFGQAAGPYVEMTVGIGPRKKPYKFPQWEPAPDRLPAAAGRRRRDEAELMVIGAL